MREHPQALLRSPTGPPRGKEDAEPGGFEKRGVASQKLVRGFGVELPLRGFLIVEAGRHRGTELGRLTQSGQKIFSRVTSVLFEGRGPVALGVPNILCRHEETSVLGGLHEVAENPRRSRNRGEANSSVYLRFFESQEKPEPTVKGDLERPAPDIDSLSKLHDFTTAAPGNEGVR